MRIVYLLIILFPFLNNSMYADDSTYIYLNIGDSIQANIIEVQSWGIKISDGRSVSYNVISKVITNNEEVVSKFKQQIPELNINENEKIYTINIPRKSLKFNPIRDRNVIAKFYVNALYMFNEDELFELQFMIDPKISKNIIFKVATSFGWDSEIKKDRLYRNMSNKSYLNLLTFGVGYHVKFEKIKILFFMNYADKIFFDGDASAIFDNKSFLYPTVNSILEYKRLNFILGSRYYFNYNSNGKKTQKLSFHLGLGITI
jgi:hypothetical protein